MKLLKNAVKTCEQLLMEYAMKDVSVTNTQKLTFTGVDNKDVYNITAPFQDEGEWVIAGRVESRDSEHSDVVFLSNVMDNGYPVKERLPLNFKILFHEN